ncbi:MAG TPA: 4'-phosphopantetheinyl transferase superfamily protein [Burkholderiales bacterium]|nr:4'-phosphopantetheinyl transferase superfamily protein [Burkholderiales bacterium]
MNMPCNGLSSEENSGGRNRPGALAPARRRNPAGLSPLLAGLFPSGVVGAELRAAGDPSLLFLDEVQYLGRAGPKRIREFAAGRLCARRALEEFGFTDYPLRTDSDRRPRWPAPLIGSITHTAGICGAVVAERRQFRAIGLDMEIVGCVTPEIWPSICTPEETRWLAALPEPEQSRSAALIFSAKESFYKCQYGVTRQWLEFDDVALDLPRSDESAGCFALRPRRRIALLEHDTAPMMGRFEFHGSLVVTGMILEAR